jgi:hypothetical protein
MPAQMIRTKTPGVFKRGGRYAVVYYDANGKQRKESARTYDDARRLKQSREADIARGEFFEASRTRFADYAREWIERYQGRGRGFRESSREDYRRLLESHAIPYFDGRLRRTVAQITPQDVASYVAWLMEQKSRYGTPLTDGSVAKALNPVRACLATAVPRA